MRLEVSARRACVGLRWACSEVEVRLAAILSRCEMSLRGARGDFEATFRPRCKAEVRLAVMLAVSPAVSLRRR